MLGAVGKTTVACCSSEDSGCFRLRYAGSARRSLSTTVKSVPCLSPKASRVSVQDTGMGFACCCPVQSRLRVIHLDESRHYGCRHGIIESSILTEGSSGLG